MAIRYRAASKPWIVKPYYRLETVLAQAFSLLRQHRSNARNRRDVRAQPYLRTCTVKNGAAAVEQGVRRTRR